LRVQSRTSRAQGRCQIDGMNQFHNSLRYVF
jgi:hypothetical protein